MNMNLSNGQINSLIALGVGVLVLILLNVLGNRGSGFETHDTSDCDTDDFDID